MRRKRTRSDVSPRGIQLQPLDVSPVYTYNVLLLLAILYWPEEGTATAMYETIPFGRGQCLNKSFILFFFFRSNNNRRDIFNYVFSLYPRRVFDKTT